LAIEKGGRRACWLWEKKQKRKKSTTVAESGKFYESKLGITVYLI
jgi:hypothetical protein